MASKVNDWAACDLRYVGENKLARLHDEELVALHQLLAEKHGLPRASLEGTREANIQTVLALKKQIARSGTAPSPPPAATAPAPAPVPHEATSEDEEPPRTMTVEEKLSEAAKAFDAMFAKELQREPPEAAAEPPAAPEAAAEPPEAPAAPEAEPLGVGATPPEVLSDEAKAAQEDRDARISAFVQLAAAVSPPAPKGDDAAPAVANESVTVDTHHRLRVCSFNACKMRLGSANKAYLETGDDGTSGEYEGTHKGAELAQKWLTLASRMADFDIIVLQEVPGAEKVMDQKIETFASMLDIATEAGREWSAVNSQKSGKNGKVVGPGAEVHVCFVKSPVQFKGWNTLRKVGATELDYAPLQVRVHDPRFADPADRDFVVTSVHLPPSKRVEARDSQIAALLRNYSAPDTSEYRMQRPFKPSKESKVAPTHIIAGDFNTYPGHERYNMLGSGFLSKIPKNAATTSGHQNYDNVLVDAHANDRLLIGGGIMQLKDPHNAARGEVGLSDHYPVFVEVREVQKTGKQPTALPVVESELVAKEGEEAPPPLEPVPEEAAGEPQPPLAEAPAPAPARKDRNYDDAGSVGSGTSESEYLTGDDGPAGLPRLVDDEEEARKGHEEEPEEPEEPQPPLAEAPAAIWDRASEEAKNSNPNYNRDQPKPEFADDSEGGEVSGALTDDGLALDLPRVVHGEPAEEVVREVVDQTMDRIMKGVLDTAAAATPAEAPPAADPATEAPPSPPPPPPPPAPDTTPTTAPLDEEWYAAWRETLAQPLAQPLAEPPPMRAAAEAALPAELPTLASGADSESGPPPPALGTVRDELEGACSECAAEDELAKDLPEAD
jgi:endonuclease/exonuclease/phosphatase family metal-dependent hydrolase